MICVVGCSSTIPVGSGGGDGGPGGGSSGSTSTTSAGGGTYTTKCQTACANAPRPCASASTDACVQTCASTLDGLATACAQCLLDHSGWSGTQCLHLGAPGGTVPFGPGTASSDPGCPDGATCGPSCPSACTCTAANESCDGFDMAKFSSSECKAFCATTVPPPSGACVANGNGASGGGGSCSASVNWSCGSDAYSIDCSCPSEQCACKKNGTTVKVIAYPYACSNPSSCDASLVPTGDCGFPIP